MLIRALLLDFQEEKVGKKLHAILRLLPETGVMHCKDSPFYEGSTPAGGHWLAHHILLSETARRAAAALAPLPEPASGCFQTAVLLCLVDLQLRC